MGFLASAAAALFRRRPRCRRCRRPGAEFCSTCVEGVVENLTGIDSVLVRKLLDSRLTALAEMSKAVTALLEAADAVASEFPELARVCTDMAARLAEVKRRATEPEAGRRGGGATVEARGRADAARGAELQK